MTLMKGNERKWRFYDNERERERPSFASKYSLPLRPAFFRLIPPSSYSLPSPPLNISLLLNTFITTEIVRLPYRFPSLFTASN